jgi:hypothetical protein
MELQFIRIQVIKKLHETYQWWMYSRELLMMGKEFARNMYKIWIISASGWLFKRNLLRCTVIRMWSLTCGRFSSTPALLKCSPCPQHTVRWHQDIGLGCVPWWFTFRHYNTHCFDSLPSVQ